MNFDDLQQWAAHLGWETGDLTLLGKFAPGAPGAEAFRTITFNKV